MACASASHSAALLRLQDDRPSFVGNPAFAESISRLGRPGDPPYSDAVLRVNLYSETFVTTSLPVIGERLRRMSF